jgi:hypothetical protein
MVMAFITPGYSYLMVTECPADGSSLTAESSSPSLLSGVASQLAAVSSVTVPFRTSGVAGRNCKQRQTQVVLHDVSKIHGQISVVSKKEGEKNFISKCVITQFSIHIPKAF